MNNNFNGLHQNDSPMLYYLLPKIVKRRCRALKNISLEQERLESKHKQLRQQVCSKYSSDQPQVDDSRPFTSPFGIQSLRVVAKKADDLKNLVTNQKAQETATSSTTGNFDSNAIRRVLDSCESKCHELLTHLANIDWELYEFEESLTLYHADMEVAMTEYNMELSALYKRRLGIVLGDYEPTDAECSLPAYLNSSSSPKYLESERVFEHLVSSREYNSNEVDLLVDKPPLMGVPKFWFRSLLIALHQLGVIETADYGPLEYLVDVRYYYDTERDSHEVGMMNSDYRTQVLLFYFDKNPHFSNRILSKTLHIDKSRRSGHRMFDGLWVSKKEGCNINWYQEQDLTRGSSYQAGDDDEVDGRMQQQQVVRQPVTPPARSFFNFFSARGLSYGRSVRHFNDSNEPVDVEPDYDIFVRFRDFIVPHAIIAYSRGNLFGFECEQGTGESLPEKLHYLNSLFDSPISNKDD